MFLQTNDPIDDLRLSCPGDHADTLENMMNRRAAVTGLSLALAGIVLLTACTGSGSSRSSGVMLGAVPNQDVIALPEDESINTAVAAALERLPDLIEETIESTQVPGMAVSVVHGDEIVFAEGYGTREVGADLAVTPDTVFQIASLSKPLSATGVAAAIGQSGGSLDWNTPITKLLPDFEFSDPFVTQRATVGDAFSHRTGLRTGAGDDLEDLGYEQTEILDRLRMQPLDEFRSTYHYSNFGLTLGAVAVAASRDQQWEELMNELVFSPIGMDSTSTEHAAYLASENRAVLHALIDGQFTPRFDRNPDPQAPAGGVSSTVEDLAQWMIVLLNEGRAPGEDASEIIDTAALREAMVAQVVSGGGEDLANRPSHYGHGFGASPLVSGRMSYSHSGAFVLGSGTAFQIVPELDLGMVVLTNGAPVGAAESVIAQFFDLVQFGTITRDWTSDFGVFLGQQLAPVGDLVGQEPPTDAALPPDMRSLLGRYENPYFGELMLEERADGLVARLGPDGMAELTLLPWDDTRLAYAPRGENAPEGSLASALISRSASGIELTLESFDAQGLGTWAQSR